MPEGTCKRKKYRQPAQHLLKVNINDGRIEKILKENRKYECAEERDDEFRTTVFDYGRVRRSTGSRNKPARNYVKRRELIGLSQEECAARFNYDFRHFMMHWLEEERIEAELEAQWMAVAAGDGAARDASPEDDDTKRMAAPVRRYKIPGSRHVAIDCEMVGVGEGGNFNALARVSIVNKKGVVLMDKYVKPTEPVVDYCTEVSGIEPHHIANGEDFVKVQQEVIDLLQGKLVVGHSVIKDFEVLHIRHPPLNIRDTALLKPLNRFMCGGFMPSLKRLSLEILGKHIQCGEHDSVVDAITTMEIYNALAPLWEKYYDTPIGNKALLNDNFYKTKPQAVVTSYE